MFERVEELIKTGCHSAASRVLRQIPPRHLPRDSLAKVASLARRANDPHWAIRLLNPIVRTELTEVQPASDEEKIVYAASLARIGALLEAEQILNEVNPRKNPDALLYKVHILVARWQYADTIPLLEEYLKYDHPEYEQIAGKLNLAAALVHENDFGRGDSLLEELYQLTTERNYRIFQLNTLELASQSAFYKKDFVTARKHIAVASHLIESNNLFMLFVYKVMALIEVFEKPNSPESLKAVLKVCARAEELENWETIRDCHYWTALATQNPDLLVRVFAGTPFEAFRQRMIRDHGRPLVLPESYAWQPERAPSRRTIDLFSDKPGRPFHGNRLARRLAGILVTDFYKPFSIAHLHSELYAGEWYNPHSSRKRVHAAVALLRTSLEKYRSKIVVEEIHGSYRLKPIRAALRIPRSAPRDEDGLVRRLVSELGQNFTAREASRVLRRPARTTGRILKDAVDRDKLERIGRGKNTHYQIKKAA